jgi:hypothetical protein
MNRDEASARLEAVFHDMTRWEPHGNEDDVESANKLARRAREALDAYLRPETPTVDRGDLRAQSVADLVRELADRIRGLL